MHERPLPPTIRRAHWRDASLLANLRAASHAERHPGDDAATLRRFRAACAAFFEAELARPEAFVRAWLALDAARCIGTVTLQILPTLPRVEGRRAVDGRIRNVFVEPAARRRGIATALVREAIADAEREGVDRLSLGASAEGRFLYEELGFVAKDDEMLYVPR